MKPNRRDFVGSLIGMSAVLGGAAVPSVSGRDASRRLHIASNQYPWLTFYGREKRNWDRDPDAALAEFAKSGIEGFEPLASSADQIKSLGPLLKKHKLEMRSLYVNSTLHDRKSADGSIKLVLAIADAARALGARIVVTNPSPLRWGGPENKSDEQLRVQAANLDRLGAALRKRGMTLAYHNHDAEMRKSAREFHHMLVGTDSAHVSFCLDSHWVFRGSGDSQVALFDIVKLHGSRIVELHLRQSKDGIWTETFGPGDIDYPKLAAELLRLKVRPHVVLEQAVEAKTPNTLRVLEAHRRSLKYAARVFAKFVS
jgi:inosose dehydratase